ncbi:MAG TPA: hypothetical protein VF360_02690 [Candidatus Methanoperedens sp.]
MVDYLCKYSFFQNKLKSPLFHIQENIESANNDKVHSCLNLSKNKPQINADERRFVNLNIQNISVYRENSLIESPQSTQRAQRCATPVTTFEKAAASRFRTRMTWIARIFTDKYESARFVFHYIPTEFITLFNNILFLEKTIHEI